MSEPETVPPIEISNLGIAYGRERVVRDVSLRIETGQIYALLGRNGAGKSSLVRCLLGQQRASRGRLRQFGLDSWRHRHRVMAAVGVVPEVPDLPPTMTATAAGSLHQRFYRDWSWQHYSERLERFGIDPHMAFSRLSRGQKTQMALSLALSREPSLLILDDPTLGLDPVARSSVFDELIEGLADRGLTVLLTSHDLAGVESLATHVGFLCSGALVIDEPLETLKNRFRRLVLAGPMESAESVLADLGPLRLRQLPWGAEAVVTRYEHAKTQRLSAVASLEDMSLDEIFVAVAGEAAPEKGEEQMRRVS